MSQEIYEKVFQSINAIMWKNFSTFLSIRDEKIILALRRVRVGVVAVSRDYR
jgi:hypothetical protein